MAQLAIVTTRAVPKAPWEAADFMQSKVLSMVYFGESAICQNMRKVT